MKKTVKKNLKIKSKISTKIDRSKVAETLVASEPELISIKKLEQSESYSGLFPRNEQVMAAIKTDMKDNDFDPAHPLIINTNGNTILDGNCRYELAKELGIKKVWVVKYKFTDEKALEYAIHCQRDRRNLDDAAIICVVRKCDQLKKPGPKAGDGNLASTEANLGKSAAAVAEKIGTSVTKVEKARSVNKSGDKQLIHDVEAGTISLNKASQMAKAEKDGSAISDAGRGNANHKKSNYTKITDYLDKAIECCGGDAALAAKLTELKNEVALKEKDGSSK